MQQSTVTLGRLGAPHGVRGWLKVHSFTNPITNILNFPHWEIQHAGQWKTVKVLNARPQGKALVVQLEGIDDRDQAALHTNSLIRVARTELPDTEADEYYWNDLIGLSVTNLEEKKLGKIIEMRDTGANDVMIIEGDKRHLVPFLKHVIQSVDLQQGAMVVDWDYEF